jgi:hypothetical protein
MDSGIAVGPVADAGVRANLTMATWELVAERVTLYLHAMGIRDPLHCERLRARIRQRWDLRVNAAPLEDRVEAAIEESCALLDQWLVGELGLEGERATLYAARAAVLSGTIADWAARFAGVSGESIAAPIRAACVQALPEPAPLPMEPSTIHLCCHHLRRRISTAFRVLIGTHPVTDTEGSRPGHPR